VESVNCEAYQMWLPTPPLLETVITIERLLSANETNIKSCVDCGCGAGRDSVFLALRKCWKVYALDNMPKALKRVEHLRDRCEVRSDLVQPLLLDVKKDPNGMRKLMGDLCASGGVDLVVVSRFFHRPLLEMNVIKDIITPGGIIFFHHFLDGVQDHPLGHPSSPHDYLLKGELRQSFSGWHVVLEDETTTLADGRPMVTFIAQKPSMISN